MEKSKRLSEAFHQFDEANGEDPNMSTYQGKVYPKELLYAMRMTDKLNDFAPNASESLQLAARCQHICRWEIPRASYEMNRIGYLKWRQDLKKFHVQKASGILRKVGHEQEVIDSVAFLLDKKQLKKNEETQILEDVICLVFLEFYFEDFIQKHSEDKLLDILRKTWRKMSKKGQDTALQLPLSQIVSQHISKALGE